MYGVVQHSGSLSGGHYVAYVNNYKFDPELVKNYLVKEDLSMKTKEEIEKIMNKCCRSCNNVTHSEKNKFKNSDSNEWYFVSDDCVRKLEERDLQNLSYVEAHILFYRRVQSLKPNTDKIMESTML